MTRYILTFGFLIALNVCTAQIGKLNQIDFIKLKWTPVDESVSYFINKTTDEPLKQGDSIILEFIGTIENSKTFINAADSFQINLNYGKDTDIVQLNSIIQKTTKHSEVYVKLNLQNLYEKVLGSYNHLTVTLFDSVSEAESSRLLIDLNRKEFVMQVSFTSKAEGLNKLKKELGEDFVKFLDYNPLSDLIDLKVKIRYWNSSDLKKIINELKMDSRIKEVIYDETFLRQIDKQKNKILIFRVRT